MKSNFFLSIFFYVIIFLGSSIILKQFESAIMKFTILVLFLYLNFFVAVKYYPFNIKPLFSIEFKNLKYLLISFFIPVFCFISIISISYFKGYLNTFSIDKINILGNIISSIYVAITEELFIRGLIFYSILKLNRNFFLALIISSIIFALFHSLGVSLLNEYPLYINYILVSIVLGYIMVLSKSIIPCFVYHFTNNLLNKIVEFDFGIYEKDITTSSSFIFLPFIFPIILLILYLITNQKKIDSHMELIFPKES